MTNLEITRIETSDAGTIGVLTIDKAVVCFTLEPPWRGNEKSISCIPTGQYYYSQYKSEKYERMCLSINSVHGRDSIAVHHGNTVGDTTGCIIPGLSVGSLNGKRAVLSSNKALDAIIANSQKGGVLTIRNGF